MSFRLVPLILLTIVTLAAPAAAQLPCANPAVDPCVIDSTVNIPVGTYNLGTKSLVFGNKQFTVTGAGALLISANNITLQPGARLIATGTDGATMIGLTANGSIDIQSQGTSKSKIDVSGNNGGGTIDLQSAGDLSVNGTLISNATNVFGFGGSIDLTSVNGNISVTGDPSEGIKSFGNAQGSGGSISLTAPLGSISINTQLVPKGGDCSDCSIDLYAGLDITTTAQGVLDMRASGVGTGGELTASTVSGNITFGGNILANGSSDDLDGGDGGTLDIDAGANIVIGGRIELNGAGRYDTGIAGFSVDGAGGSADFLAVGDITMNGPMFAIGKGYGVSDDFDFDAGGNVNFNAEIDLTGDVFGANLTLSAQKAVTINGRVRTQTMVDPNIDLSVLGGGFDMEACQINITATGELIATGPGKNPSGSNLLAASTGLTIGGKLIATDLNQLSWRTSQPIITGTVSPPPVLVQNPNLACCGVQCPLPTTTTTSSTSTTSTSSSSTSIAPTTSSTSSTIIVPTTTSTTSATPTTVVPTTSSTSSTSPIPTTTTSSSTTLQSTTTTSSTTPTTSSTSLASTTSTSQASSTTSTSLGSTTSTSIAATTSTTGGTTSSTTSSTAASTTSAPPTTSTVATTSSTSSTAIGSTTSSSTLVPVTTSTLVVPTSSTTTVVRPTTTSTTIELTCFDTAVGIAAVQCRLDAMNDAVLGASQDDLGGKKIARQVTKLLDRATTLVQEGAPPKKLKNAQKKLRSLVTKLNNALGKGNADAQLVNELSELATEAQSELTALTT